MKQASAGRLPDTFDHSLRSLDFLQVLFFVQTVQVGIGLFNMPRVVSEEAGHDGWMAILLSGAGSQISIALMIVLLRRFGNLDVYGIFNRLFGKWIGRALGLCFSLYCVAVAALVSRSYIEVVQSWLFPTTSTMMFYVLFLLPCIYCATGGPRVLGQFAIVTFFATVWMMLILIEPGRQVETSFYFPLFEASLGDLARAVWKVSASVVGFELVLVIYPYIQNKKKAMLASSLGIWFTTLIYLTVTVIAIGFYSQGQIQTILSPTLHMFKIFMMPLLERIEHLGITTWSFLIVNTAASYLWSAGRFLYGFGKWKEPTCILLYVPLLFALGIFPQDIFLLTQFELYLGTVGGLVSLLLPVVLLSAALLLRKKGQPPQEDQPNQEPNQEPDKEGSAS